MGGSAAQQAPGSTQKDLAGAYGTSSGLIGTSSAAGKDLINSANASFAQRGNLLDPYIKQQQAIASGNMGDITTAMSLPLASLEAQKKATKEQIMSTIPPGATRDYALAEADRKATSTTYDFLRSSYLQAPKNLADVGTQEGQFGLAQLGAGFGGINSALSGSNNLYGTGVQAKETQDQIEAQRRQATLSFIGNLVGAVAGPLTGGVSKLFTGSGGSSPSASTTPIGAWGNPYSGTGAFGGG